MTPVRWQEEAEKAAQYEDEGEWFAPEFAAAREATEGISWDFDGWRETLYCLENGPGELGGISLLLTREDIQHQIDAAYDCDWHDEVDRLKAKLAALPAETAQSFTAAGIADPFADTSALFGAAVKRSKSDLIDMIEAAQANWDSCDWTHELRDLDGEIQRDEDENAIMCDGGHEDECATCRDALKDAQAAIALGDEAVKTLKSGDIAAAKEHVSAARDLESEWGDCPAWREVADAMEAIRTYDEAYRDSDVPEAVSAAIKHANWFPEEDERLRSLAREGKAQEIRDWAQEIRTDWNDESEDAKYWQVTADMWDLVADAVDALRAEVEIAE